MPTLDPQASISALLATAAELHSPCNTGDLVWRKWSDRGENLLLMHGGSGSWSHWFRNISFLRSRYALYTLDLPGLGDSAALPDGYTAEAAVAVVSTGLQQLFVDQPLHICAFSWGCAVTAQLAARHVGTIKSLCLIGPASLGDIPRRGGMKPLIKRTPDMTAEQIFAANKENLARLMFFDRSRIDDLAVVLQTINTSKARFNSPQFARSTLVLDGIAAHRIPLKVVYGAADAPALPDVAAKGALIRERRPDAEFHIEPDCGHWLQYEQPAVFHQHLASWIDRHT